MEDNIQRPRRASGKVGERDTPSTQSTVVKLERLARRPATRASDHEIGELVLGAWFIALEAEQDACPELAIEPAARRKREHLAEKVEQLPYAQLLDPLVQREYWRQVAMISEQELLARHILEGVDAYAAKTLRS